MANKGDLLLEMKDVKKRFGGAIALRGTDLSVRAGEIHALLGENGAGKSTMLKILAGVHEHDSGTITLGGAPFISGSPQASINQGIAVIYQEPSLFLDLSLAENVFVGRQPKKDLLSIGKRQSRKQRLSSKSLVSISILSDKHEVSQSQISKL